MWHILYKPAFLRDMARLPEGVRPRVEQMAFHELPAAGNPFTIGGLEKLQGYRDYYRIRFGDYRVGVTIDSQARTVELWRVLHRRGIYRHFP